MMGLLISVTVIALALLLLRRLFQERLHPGLQYALWSLIPLRLIAFGAEQIVRLPESPFSVMNAAEAAVQTARRVAFSHSQQVWGMWQGTGAAPIGSGMPAGDVDAACISAGWEGAQAPFTSAGLLFPKLLFGVWLAGAFFVFAWFLVVNAGFQKQLRAGQHPMDERELAAVEAAWCSAGISEAQRIDVKISTALASPCLTGYGGCCIWIPQGLAKEPDYLKYALLHEFCHKRQGDLLWSAVRSAVLVALWFHPLLWLAAAASRRDCELSCDAAVLRRIGREERLQYGRALLQMLSAQRDGLRLISLSAAMCDSKSGIRERIIRIASPRKMAALAVAATIFAVAIITGSTFTQAMSGLDEDAQALAPVGSAEQSESAKQMPQRQQEVFAQWAEAFTQRDGSTIYQLCADEALYLSMGDIITEEDGSKNYVMGVSSPWPWVSDYKIEARGELQADIYYRFRTSTDVYIARESVTLAENSGQIKVAQTQWKHFDAITSAAEFDESYGAAGLLRMSEYAEFYRDQARLAQTGESLYADAEGSLFERPAQAACCQLHVQAEKTQLRPQADGSVEVAFFWSDGQRSVVMEQQDGIWLPKP